MAITTRISATTSANTSYTFNLADGSKTTFACSNLSANEKILIQKQTSSSYDDLYYEDEAGNNKIAALSARKNTITIVGPFEGRINKPVTINAVEVVEYS